MARKKKDTEELEMELDELELDEEETSDEEDADEEELKEPEAISLSNDDEDEADIEPAPKAPRRRAAKKAPKVESKVEAEEVGVEKPAKAPKKTEAPVAAAVAVPAPEAKDTVVLQWEAAKQASESIVGSLDKVNSMLRELPEYYSTSLQKAFKNNTPRTSPAAKVAFGMSLVATVLSVLSLSFSQSARQAALTQVAVPAIHQMAPAPEKKIEQAAAEAPKKKARKTR